MSEQGKSALLAAARERMREKGRQGLRRVPPRPRRPEQQIREYRARLRDVTSSLESEVRARVFPEIEGIIDEAGMREDAVRADQWGQRLMDLFAASRTAIEPVVGRTISAMLSIGDEVEGRATSEQAKAVRAVLGVRPTFYDDARVSGLLNAWKQQNRAFITRMTDDAVQQMQDAASRAVRQGQSASELRKTLRYRFGVSHRRARTIARTEVSQLNTQITQSRQKDVGITGYTWTDSGDERVRESHEDMDGRYVEWDDPPSLTDGQHAGEPVNCRCVARAAVDRLLDELEVE